MSRGSIISMTSSSSPSTTDTSFKSNRKYWGEEVLADAIYNVFLKKITYSGSNSHASLSPNHSSCPNGHHLHAPDSGISSVSSSSAESDLVDGIQRVFRRRSSFDKSGLKEAVLQNSSSSHIYNKRNNRSASVSTPLSHHHQFKNGIMSSYNHLPDMSFKSSHMDNPRMKNYHRLTSEGDSYDSRKKNTKVRTSSPEPPSQSLQWETRQIKTLKAATLEHIVQYILFVTERQKDLKSSKPRGDDSSSDHCQSVVLEEERNNVSHVIHILFVAYRLFASPIQLFQLIQSVFCQHLQEHDQEHVKSNTPATYDTSDTYEVNLVRQLNFVLHYWLSNYPEDFLTPLKPRQDSSTSSSSSLMSNGSMIKPPDGSEGTESHSLPTKLTETSSTSSLPGEREGKSSRSKSRERSKNRKDVSETNKGHQHEPKLVDSVLCLPRVDDGIYRKALAIIQDYRPEAFLSEGDSVGDKGLSSKSSSSSSAITELDARFIAQQLTAIDLENFLSLKPYFLLEGTRSNAKVQQTIQNFNQLSRQVIISILKSPSPDIVTSHWIEVALHLRRMKNFNSLKAVIAGLTNESIHRLKNVVWSKLGKTTLSNFKTLSSVVDDVNNQTVLRQTQLEVEGTAKVSLQEDFSFGTIPYLGTFFTDLTFIDSRFPSTLESKTGEKMINLEKCSKQFEVLTQVQLLQKNVKAALMTHNQMQNLHALSPGMNLSVSSIPVIPRVARIFRTWFSDPSSSLSDNECYKMSLSLEAPTPRKQ